MPASASPWWSRRSPRGANALASSTRTSAAARWMPTVRCWLWARGAGRPTGRCDTKPRPLEPSGQGRSSSPVRAHGDADKARARGDADKAVSVRVSASPLQGMLGLHTKILALGDGGGRRFGWFFPKRRGEGTRLCRSGNCAPTSLTHRGGPDGSGPSRTFYDPAPSGASARIWRSSPVRVNLADALLLQSQPPRSELPDLL